jgi:hypothetical protein
MALVTNRDSSLVSSLYTLVSLRETALAPISTFGPDPSVDKKFLGVLKAVESVFLSKTQVSCSAGRFVREETKPCHAPGRLDGSSRSQ